jgi:uncharacterized protein DUF3303
MKFIVELRINAGGKTNAIEAFELRGPNRHSGVIFRGAWVGTRSDVVFVLAESEDEALVDKAAKFWNEHGECQITPVLDIEQF